jgi:hypothetical protein
MSLIGIDGESDEEFARRLQAREMGINLNISLSGNSSSPRREDRADSNTPLIDAFGNNIVINRIHGSPNNPTIINARLNELATSRATVIILLVVNIPQIIATIIVLYYNWNDDTVCDQENRNKWKLWSLISALRMLLYSITVVCMHFTRTWLETNGYLLKITQFRNGIDAAGLIWYLLKSHLAVFIYIYIYYLLLIVILIFLLPPFFYTYLRFLIGNVWVFGDEVGCNNPTASATYNLCVSMLIINYIQICLPCIIALCMIPVFCFCMPCLIRILARLQNQNAPKGATDTLINTLPLVTISEPLIDDERTCPVCLNEMVVGDQARTLPCRHLFHKNVN